MWRQSSVRKESPVPVSSQNALRFILVTGYWLLATGYWLLATRFQS